MKKRIEVVMAVLLLVGAYFFAREGAHMVENMRAQKGEVCIVIDAGHGGIWAAQAAIPSHGKVHTIKRPVCNILLTGSHWGPIYYIRCLRNAIVLRIYSTI